MDVWRRQFDLGRKLCVNVTLALSSLSLVGCEQKMAQQPRFDPLEAMNLFENGQSARPAPEHTIARGQLETDRHFFAGRKPDASRLTGSNGPQARAQDPAGRPHRDLNQFVDSFPFRVDDTVMERGRERYGIFCALCHDPIGSGKGIIVQRGFTKPPSFHGVSNDKERELRTAPVGHFFDVISNGLGAMPSYGDQIPPRDRWAIIAYIRALQLSQNFPVNELKEEERNKLISAQPSTVSNGKEGK